MAKDYKFSEIEKKWVKAYADFGGYRAVDFDKTREKKYVLVEFPYPSGSGLHVGHAFSMTGADVYARYMRTKGYNVLFPMGWDAFGLPTENYAIRSGISPQKATKDNTQKFREQMDQLGLSFDWSREVNTTDASFYKWTQWIFIKLFEKGLAQKEEMPINWCPKCKIGLANEEVIDGKCERCGTGVERRTISQWVVKITKYADRLIEGLKRTDFIEKVKAAQINWIGKKEGINIRFKVSHSRGNTRDFGVPQGDTVPQEYIKVFTTTPVNFGASFLAVAPEHQLVKDLINGKLGISDDQVGEIRKYISETGRKSDFERAELNKTKTGVFSGLYALNHVTKKEIPIWIADFVLMSVGTGAVQGCPGHDQRDWEFAKKFGIEITPVVMPQREYVDENAKGYYAKRQNKNWEIIVKLNSLAQEADKTFMIHGGWGAMIQAGQEYRECEDIDVSILEQEKEWWKENLTSLGFQVGPIFGQENPDEYFQAIKKPEDEVDTHIDINVLKNIEGYEWKEFRNNKFLVQKKELIIAEKEKGISGGKVKRWKEDADFLMLGHRPYVVHTGDRGTMIDSDFLNGMDFTQAMKKTMDYFEEKGWGKRTVSYHLRDWIFSRQHYWGEPVPMIYCDKDGWQTVPEDQLPIQLPEVEKYQPTDTGESSLANIKEFVETTCPKCAGKARRETDTMPNWAGSDWYFLRYLDPNNGKSFADMEKMNYWLPVDIYVGGDEHNTLHLLYSRFIYQFLWDLGVVPKDKPEPYQKRLSHGVILAPDGNRMSKTRGNVIVPDEVAAKFGADATRTYLMFMGPFDATMAWNERSLTGVKRFIERLYRLVAEGVAKGEKSDEVSFGIINKLVKKIDGDLAVMKFNTAISAAMGALNGLTEDGRRVGVAELKKMVVALAVFVPFVAEELWQRLGGEFSVHTQKWPMAEKIIEKEVTMVVQVEGKTRKVLSIKYQVSSDKDEVEKLALEQPGVLRWLEGKKYKVIFVPGKIINFVLTGD